MKINVLSGILNQYFCWNKARMDCFSGMLLALFKVRTVNLTALAAGFETSSKQESRYRRLRRFFKEFEIDFLLFSSWILMFFELSQKSLELSIDRTNWRWGKKDINILMLSVVYKGIALPLFWILLPKKGNSSEEERISIMTLFMNRFPNKKISCLFGDREFIGDKWFGWLNSKNIPYCIRIKKNAIVTNAHGKNISVHQLFFSLEQGEQLILKGRRKLWNQRVYLSALRLETGELLIVASNYFINDPIKQYGKRWEIETLFSCLKSRGFNFEDTHIVDPDRIRKLIALLAIAFCWAHKTGEWRHEQKPIKVKKHGRKSQSYFRYGLNLIRDVVLNSLLEKKDLLENQLLSFLNIHNCLVVRLL